MSAEPCPQVVAELSPSGLSLVVKSCPHCGKQHRHGAGGGYGARESHCRDGSRCYELVRPFEVRVSHEELLPSIVVEGACDYFCGRPRERNPYSREYAAEGWASWDFGWDEGAWFLEIRGQEEARRWLGEAA